MTINELNDALPKLQEMYPKSFAKIQGKQVVGTDEQIQRLSEFIKHNGGIDGDMIQEVPEEPTALSPSLNLSDLAEKAQHRPSQTARKITGYGKTTQAPQTGR